jgi:hypothetical protein
MNVLSSEDANGSSVQSLQAYKKNRKAQAALFSSYESAVQKSSERQVAKALGAGLSHLKLVDIEINVVLSASFQPKRQCSGQECIEVI